LQKNVLRRWCMTATHAARGTHQSMRFRHTALDLTRSTDRPPVPPLAWVAFPRERRTSHEIASDFAHKRCGGARLPEHLQTRPLKIAGYGIPGVINGSPLTMF
jgi:hypothetical protein